VASFSHSAHAQSARQEAYRVGSQPQVLQRGRFASSCDQTTQPHHRAAGWRWL